MGLYEAELTCPKCNKGNIVLHADIDVSTNLKELKILSTYDTISRTCKCKVTDKELEKLLNNS
jgi:hypothetical protein